MESQSAALLRRLNRFCAQALEGAASLCQTRTHAEICPEHWILKLLEQGEGDITLLARRYQWDMDGIWQSLLTWLDKQPRSVRSRPQLSSGLQRLLQQAWLMATMTGDAQIRGQHLLMAMVGNPALVSCDGLWPMMSLTSSQLERLRPVLDVRSNESSQQQFDDSDLLASAAAAVPLTPGNNDVLNRYTVDLTASAREGRIDPVFGRDNEIRQMVDILLRRRKNNPILVGEPGVGKTALVEGLALLIAEGGVPESLKSVAVRTLDLGLLQAGAGVKGQFEQRLKDIIEAVQKSSQPILLFIDEAHTIIGAGNQTGGADAANLLKPALARGELRTIAATTWSEYKQYFERDAALERRFQMVKVEEPDDKSACLMLRGLKSRYAEHHHVHITDEAVRAAVTLSRRYLTGRQLPDKAVDLLDTAAARVRMSQDTLPEELTAGQSQLSALTIEQQQLLQDLKLAGGEPCDRLAEIDRQMLALQEKLAARQCQYQRETALITELQIARADISKQQSVADIHQRLLEAQRGNPLLALDVDARTIASVVADWTGIPVGSLIKDEQTELLTLEHQLASRVVGQEMALNAIARRLRAAKSGLTAENGPQGAFLLVGTSGVGKTETALALAETVYGGEKSLITINLAEYHEAHTVSQLKGSPPGYVGYGRGGILTEAVRQRPYSIVLLDEVEKAHRDVLNLFWQVFDRGFMRDGEGREIDFRNTVIVMTSNLGSEQLMRLFDKTPDASDAEMQALLQPLLCAHFQPALLARFQTIIYRPLTRDAMRTIVTMKLAQISQRLARHYGIRPTIGEGLYDGLTTACLQPESGARYLDSLLNQQILPVLSQQILRYKAPGRPQWLMLDWCEEEGIVLSFEEPAKETEDE